MNKVLLILCIIGFCFGVSICVVSAAQFDFDFKKVAKESLGESKIVEKKYNPESISSLDIDVNISKVDVVTADVSDIVVTCTTYKRYEYEIEIEEGVLSIETDDSWWAKGFVNIFTNMVFDAYEIKILVPEEKAISFEGDFGASKVAISDLKLNDLDIELGSGKINLENIDVSSNSNIKLASGELNVKDSSFAYGSEIKIASGDANIINSTFGDTEVKLASGDLNITDCIFSNLKTSIVSGDLDYLRCFMKDVTLKVSSGKVEMDDVSFEDLNFSVLSGKVDIHSVDSFDDYDVSVKVSSGDCNIRSVEHGGIYNITGRVSSGDVEIKFAS